MQQEDKIYGNKIKQRGLNYKVNTGSIFFNKNNLEDLHLLDYIE